MINNVPNVTESSVDPALEVAANNVRLATAAARQTWNNVLDLERYFEQCRSNGRYPQLWVSSGVVAGHFDTLADRLRYNQLNARVRRFGELLSYCTGRYPFDDQQTLLTGI